ncbi:MAG TPA: DUF3592 domain-containing protein [Spirochaetota bacterium]|nr:DUF3592 domain-containing protein [Spirochaetota bacterium]HPU87708.1 DUF3592 domain-containing protein [Spirochaetota bacterium]
MIDRLKKFAPHSIGPLIIAIGIAVHAHESGVRDRFATAPGVVTHAEIYTQGSGPRTTVHVLVKYSYTVGGAAYESHGIGMARIFYKTREEAERAIAPYPTGGAVTVHYDTADPRTAYLDVAGPGNGQLAIVLGVLVGLVISPVTMLIRRRSRRETA